jgi:hypothetical protein
LQGEFYSKVVHNVRAGVVYYVMAVAYKKDDAGYFRIHIELC